MKQATEEQAEAARRHPVVTATVAVFTGLGVWSFFAPRSFYDVVATYPPYNEHLFHDIGAFQIGIGVALFLAMRVRSGFTAALAANAVAALLHAVSHIIDRDLGGRASDPWLLSAVAIALVVPAARRLAGGRR